MNSLKNSYKEIIQKGARIELAKRKLIDFITYTKEDYIVNWHHEYICNILQDFIEGKIKKLVLSVPPQHGKSEIASRRLPAYLFGKFPDKRIAGCSYNDTFAAKFNRQIQRIIDDQKYRDVFHNTILNTRNTLTNAKQSYLRNAHEFEIVNNTGSYISVGIGGGITGNPVDILIIDDPIKGREAANSKTIRDKLWEWYTDEALTRLHNDSQQLIIMTRWHHDDIIGRLNEYEKNDWISINLPSIKENNDNHNDIRQIGESLWPEKHSLERLLKIKEQHPKTFNSLYQGNPTIEDGDMFKRDYFEIIGINRVPQLDWELYIDGAYTKNTSNDPTGLWLCAYSQKSKTLFVRHAISKYLEFPELIKYIRTYFISHSLPMATKIYIEPKASGLSAVQTLKSQGYNAIAIKNKYVNISKEERVNSILPFAEASRVRFVKDSWNEEVLIQLGQFPNGVHDEYVDLLCYSSIKHFLLTTNEIKPITHKYELY